MNRSPSPRAGSTAKNPMSARSARTASTDSAARSKRHQLHGHPEPPPELPGEVDGDPGRLAARRIPVGQDRVAEVDRGAQDAVGREHGGQGGGVGC